MSNTVRFRSIYLHTLAQFAAKHDVRYYLNGFHIEPAPQGGVTLMATDGNTLVVIHDPDGWTDKTRIFPIPALPMAQCKKCDGTEHSRMISISNDEARLHDEFNQLVMAVPCREINFKPVDWRRVVRPENFESMQHERICMNMSYLKRVADAMAVLQRTRTVSAQLIGSPMENGVTQILPTIDSGHKVMFLVMPMRDTMAKKTPSWLANCLKVPAKPDPYADIQPTEYEQAIAGAQAFAGGDE